MTNLIIQVSKYLIIILMALYTFQCFTVFRKRSDEDRDFLFLRQNVLMFFLHFVAFTVLYLEMGEVTVLLFYAAQAVYLAVVLILYTKLYPKASRLLINNMCMLITVGFIMITRLSYDQSVKQFQIIAASTVVAPYHSGADPEASLHYENVLVLHPGGNRPSGSCSHSRPVYQRREAFLPPGRHFSAAL